MKPMTKQQLGRELSVATGPIAPRKKEVFTHMISDINTGLETIMKRMEELDERLQPFSNPHYPTDRKNMDMEEIPPGLSALREVNLKICVICENFDDILSRLEL